MELKNLFINSDKEIYSNGDQTRGFSTGLHLCTQMDNFYDSLELVHLQKHKETLC
jgi:hypothetical protein